MRFVMSFNYDDVLIYDAWTYGDYAGACRQQERAALEY